MKSENRRQTRIEDEGGNRQRRRMRTGTGIGDEDSDLERNKRVSQKEEPTGEGRTAGMVDEYKSTDRGDREVKD